MFPLMVQTRSAREASGVAGARSSMMSPGATETEASVKLGIVWPAAQVIVPFCVPFTVSGKAAEAVAAVLAWAWLPTRSVGRVKARVAIQMPMERPPVGAPAEAHGAKELRGSGIDQGPVAILLGVAVEVEVQGRGLVWIHSTQGLG